ncbi:MAG: helix-turn-helix transcriptional regulator [Candidatus Hydrogenedentes bacterium]|nr:helix-turn-helix transcriptional regulator [Candidatus Hydrogenedentota bacterium]
MIYEIDGLTERMGHALRVVRVLRCKKQGDLAKTMKVSQATVSALEKGETASITTFASAAYALGINLAHLVSIAETDLNELDQIESDVVRQLSKLNEPKWVRSVHVGSSLERI